MTHPDLFHDPDIGRTRVVTRQWVRDPKGPLLTKPPPAGTRAPNGLIWGHSVEDFFWIERLPEVGVLTIWSRSMVREYGENYTEDEFDEPEPRPRMRRPWPVLRLARGARVWLEPPLGAMDEGSDHEDEGEGKVGHYRILEDDDEPGAIADECCCGWCGAEEDGDVDEENTMANDGPRPLVSSLGVRYSRLWKPEPRENFEYAVKHGLVQPMALVGKKKVEGNVMRAHAADTVGLFPVLVEERVDAKDGSMHQRILGPLICVHGPGAKSCCQLRRARREKEKEDAKRTQPASASSKDALKRGDADNARDSSQVEEKAAGPGRMSDASEAAAANLADAMQVDEEEKIPREQGGNNDENAGRAGAGADNAPSDSTKVEDNAAEPGPTSDASQAVAADLGDAMEVDEGEKVPGEEGSKDDKNASEDAEEDEEEDEEELAVDSPVIEPKELDGATAQEPEPTPWVALAHQPATLVPRNSQELYTDLPAFDAGHFDPAGLPKLEEFIPEDFFPDALMVHTLDGAGSERVRKYVRALPVLDRNPLVEKDGQGDAPRAKPAPAEARVAHLYTCTSETMYRQGGALPNKLGVGHHSSVQRAPLALPAPLTARSRAGLVTVAAKTARGLASARNHLRNEAQVYAAFPQHLMEEWCGYNLVTPCKHPVPIGPVVPKFYGYYVPVRDDGSWEDQHWPTYDENHDRRVHSDSPLLLMEECGDPIDPAKFSLDERSECYSLILRLHYANVVQQSMYIRNVLTQPGPLTKPPHLRSAKTPSFRIIDFGRAILWRTYIDQEGAELPENSQLKGMERVERRSRQWNLMTNEEQDKAQEQLRIENWEY